MTDPGCSRISQEQRIRAFRYESASEPQHLNQDCRSMFKCSRSESGKASCGNLLLTSDPSPSFGTDILMIVSQSHYRGESAIRVIGNLRHRFAFTLLQLRNDYVSPFQIPLSFLRNSSRPLDILDFTVPRFILSTPAISSYENP